MGTVGIVLIIVVYLATIGAVRAWMRWLNPPKGYADGEPEHTLAGIFWPFVVPAVLSNLAFKRLFGHIDTRRQAAAKEAEELRKRVAELDEELRASKSSDAT